MDIYKSNRKSHPIPINLIKKRKKYKKKKINNNCSIIYLFLLIFFKRIRIFFLLFLLALVLYGVNMYLYMTNRIKNRSHDNTFDDRNDVYSSFNPKNVIENDILPITDKEVNNNNLRHANDKDNVKTQLEWAKDGTIVKRIGEKGLIGELIGLPFVCPSYYYLKTTVDNNENKKIYCVQVFFKSNSRFIIEPLHNYKLSITTNMLRLRLQLAKFWKLSKRLDSFIIRLLFETYKNRPLLMILDESSFFVTTDINKNEYSNKIQLFSTAKTGMDIHVEICTVVKWLNRVYNIPRDGNTDTLMVNYGTQKSAIFFNLYLMSVVGNFNMLMLNNYIYFKPTIEKIVYEKNKNVKNLILFIPSYISDEVCKMSNEMLINKENKNINIEQIVLIAINTNKEIECPSLSEKAQDKIKFNAYTKMIKEYDQWQCSNTPLTTSTFPVKGRHYIARSNAKNEAEIVEYSYKFTEKYHRSIIYNRLHRIPLLPSNIMISNHVFPMSSGDTTTVFESLAYGRITALTPLNFARFDTFSNLIQPSEFGGSPVQLPQVHEEFVLKHQFGKMNKNNIPGVNNIPGHDITKFKIVHSNRLNMCYTGGGFPNPYINRFLTDTDHCPGGVLEGWGSYESWDIGWGEDNVYQFVKTNVLDWEVADFGPYKKEKNQHIEGELLLRTKAMNQHDDKKYNSERYFMMDGQKFFHTRDIIKVVGGTVGEVEGAKISMIDKTTCPFQLKNRKWIRTGIVERAIEGGQTVFLNSVIFGSMNSNDIIAVVWLSTEANIKYRDDDENNSMLLQYLRNILKDQVYDYEIPKYVIKSDEPWEYRPRAKIRKVLQLKFGSLVNKIIPKTVDSIYAGNVNLAVEKNIQFTKRIKNEIRLLLGDGSCQDNIRINICNILLGCFTDKDGDKSCMIRTKSGLLREPSLRHIPYKPDETMSLADRLNRYDNEPWHYWDLQEERSDNILDVQKFTKFLLTLRNNKERIEEVLPLILPSLGLLIPYGIRFRMRLDCLIRIATVKPTLLSQKKMTKALYVNVLKICRHEWFEDYGN